jgi:hypothetical protein
MKPGLPFMFLPYEEVEKLPLLERAVYLRKAAEELRRVSREHRILWDTINKKKPKT